MSLYSALQPAGVGSSLTSQPTGLLDLLLGNSNPLASFADSHANTLGAIGAGLASGPTLSQGLANAAQMVPQAKMVDQQTQIALKQQSQTYQYLQQKYPDLAQAVLGGMPIQTAWAEAMKRDNPTPVALGADQQLVIPSGPNQGKVVAGMSSQWRPLTDPAERAQFGIPASDTTPYQVNQQGKLQYAGGPQSTVNVNNTSESAFNKAVGDARGANYTAIIKGAQDAQQQIQTLGQLGGALSGAGYQGAGGEQILQLRKLAESLGLPIDPSATDNAQIAQALSRQLALQYRNPDAGAGMPGSLSNSDRDFLASMAPGLDKTPSANQKLVDALTKVQQRKIEVASLADQYVKQYGTLDAGFNDLVTKYNRDHPIFGGATNFATGAGSGNTTSTGVTWSFTP